MQQEAKLIKAAIKCGLAAAVVAAVD